MLNMVLDYSLFEHFIRNYYGKPVSIDTIEDNEFSVSFINFLRENNIVLTNFQSKLNPKQPNPKNKLLNELICKLLGEFPRGRDRSSFIAEEKFKKPHKCIFPKGTNVYSLFFLNEPDEKEKQKYRQKNGFLFGFMEDYPETWKSLSLLGKSKVLPVRRIAAKRFDRWEQLSDYITPFTDLIIVDNYMFNESLWDYNLFPIIRQFEKKTPIKFNLLLVSHKYKGKNMKDYIRLKDGELNINEIGDKIKKKLKDINCNLSIIMARDSLKEHDRGIFTNYLWISSEKGFNYFKNKWKYTENLKTTIHFRPLAEPDPGHFEPYQAVLNDISEIIETDRKFRKNNPQALLHYYGNLENRLLPDQ